MRLKIGQKENTASAAPKLLPRIRHHISIETCLQCRCMLNETNSQNGSNITYCRECGLVSSAASKGNNGVSEMKCVEDEQYANAMCMLGPKHQKPETISQMWLSQSKPSDQTEKNFALILAEITRIVHALSVERLLAVQAGEICRQALEKGLSRGSSLSVLAAAAVYASARLALVPLTVEEVAANSALPKSDVIHCFRRLQRKLGLTFAPPSPQAHALRILNLLSLHLEGQLAIIANKILETAEKNGVAQGRNPAAVAAAAIYAASLKVSESHPELTQRKLAQVANITETTIRRVYQSLDL